MKRLFIAATLVAVACAQAPAPPSGIPVENKPDPRVCVEGEKWAVGGGPGGRYTCYTCKEGKPVEFACPTK